MKILWIPHVSWRTPQRAHIFCRALSSRHEVHATDWAADFSSIRDYVSARYARNFFHRSTMDGGITVHGIPRISPALFFSPLRRLNEIWFTHSVAELIRRHRFDAVVSTFVAAPPNAARLVFDLFDDNPAFWRSYGLNPAYADEIAEMEDRYLRRSDAVVAVSRVLAERASGRTHAPVHWIPNGVDLARFRSAEGSAFRRLWNSTGPVIGMLGNHNKPVEVERFLDAAGILAREGMTFVIAGRGTAMPLARREAARRGYTHIRFFGAVPMDQAAEMVASFDVGVCPYRKTPGADAASPMRLLMYAAAGIPSVCTDLEEVRRMGFSSTVLTGDDSESLAEGIRRAAGMPRGREAAVEAYDLPVLVKKFETVLRG